MVQKMMLTLYNIIHPYKDAVDTNVECKYIEKYVCIHVYVHACKHTHTLLYYLGKCCNAGLPVSNARGIN